VLTQQLIPFSSLDCLPVPVAVVSSRGEYLFANASLCALFSVTRDEAGRPCDETLPRLASGRIGEFAIEIDSAHGHSLPVRMQLRMDLVEIGGGMLLMTIAPPALRGTGFDAYQADSFHAQRLETLGMLAGGVAHDFNNVLAGILGHITYLKTILPQRGAHTESLTAIEEGARKASTMTQQILNFSKLESAEQVCCVDVGSLATRTASLLRGALSPDFMIQCQVPVTPVSMLASEGKLAQVLVNLAINARDASKPGDTIVIEVKLASDHQEIERAFGASELSAEEYLCLSVKDHGHGMSSDVMRRIFEPYFSTKGAKGTGLGLATVASIIRQFGGAIAIDSVVGLGTTMKVFLPMVSGAAESRISPSIQHEERPALAGGHERILVIDDESPVRNVLSLSLQHLGYSVEMAGSGAEGINRYQSKLEAGGFDLVVLDMLMPQASGDQVFFALQSIDSSVRVLLMSGYSSEMSVQAVLENGGLGFLQKPFTIEELSKQVRACLDEARAPTLDSM